MSQAEVTMEAAETTADDLEPYRQLVELQKQMIELIQQHEKTKGECAALREQLMEEMTRLRRPRWTVGGISQPAATWVKHITTLWKAPRENRPQSDAPFLSQNRLIGI